MSKEIIDEILAVTSDIKNQLKFFGELGLEDLGSSPRDAKAAPPAGSASAVLANPQTRRSQEEPEGRVTDKQGPLDSTQIAKSTTATDSLFGEVRAAAPRGKWNRAVSLPVIESNDASLDAIREDIGDCQRCRLHEQRKTIVFGEGNPQARLAFVGEGPGAEEDASGRPFVGRAGQLLDKIIAAIGMKREDVYIANIVKCRPPGNRTPERDEVETCEPFLLRQLAFVRPEVIVALGSPAFQCLLKTREPITRARGQWREWNGIRVMPTFHPAFLLRSPDKKREVWEDMKKVRDYLSETAAKD